MCDCYVRTLKPEHAFGVRRGAHELSCLEYRESQDPVDRAQDGDLRASHLEGSLKPALYRTCPFREPNCTDQIHRQLAAVFAGTPREGARW
jgi:hypothetical protein